MLTHAPTNHAGSAPAVRHATGAAIRLHGAELPVARGARPPRSERSLMRYLEIPTSLPVLEIVRIGNSGADDKPVEVTEYIVASDRVETVHVLRRDASAQDAWPKEES